MTPKEAYEARKAERARMRQASQYDFLDALDRVATAFERIAASLEPGGTPVAWQVREKSTQFDDCEWGEWHQVVPDFAARVQRDGGRINDHTIGDVRALVPASALSTATGELNDAEVELQIAAAKAKGDAAAIASLQAEVDMLGKQIERMEYGDGDAEHWRGLAEKAIRERDEARAEVKALNAIRQANYEAMKLMGAKIENGSASVNALRERDEARGALDILSGMHAAEQDLTSQARADAIEEAAKFMERRADEIQANASSVTGQAMARIFLDEATAIRAILTQKGAGDVKAP